MADPEVPATTPEEPRPTETPTEPTPAEAPKEPNPEEMRLRAENDKLNRAYVGLQQKYQATYDRANASTALMEEMAQNVKLLRESQTALVKSTMGEEQAASLDARIKAASEDSQRQRAAQSAMQFIEAQTRLFTESLQAAGVDTGQIAWPTDAGSVGEWHERAKTEVMRAIGTSREKYVKAVETANARAKEAARAEAEKIADKSLREAGVGRIDSSKGAASTLTQRMAALSPTSPEFQELIKQAKRGDFTKI